MKVVSSESMQRWESVTIRGGVSPAVLMRDAVAGCVKELVPLLPKHCPVVVLCGKGNNGNDGIAIAKKLKVCGWDVEVVLSHKTEERTPHPYGDEVNEFLKTAKVWPDLPAAKVFPSRMRVVIDALLGLGSKGAPKGVAREMIEWAKREKGARDFYVSIDMPSGLDGDSGEELEVSFPSDLTLCIGALKQGCLRDSAQDRIGVLRGIPIRLGDAGDEKLFGDFITLDDAGDLSRRKQVNSNKHRQGVVGIWAGSPGMTGAALLSARAAMRSGAGLVKLFTVDDAVKAVSVATPEVMPRVIEEGVGPSDEFFECDALVIGPGLGRTDTTKWLFEQAIKKIKSPVVFDADALYFLASKSDLLKKVPGEFILTPHTGEMERLIGRKFSERREVAVEWVGRYGGCLVLKGPNTLVADRDGISWNGSGNPAMATGGMGDVLAGLIGGLLAQGYGARESARLGVYWHGYAADLMTPYHGERGLIASDVVGSLGLAWQQIRQGA